MSQSNTEVKVGMFVFVCLAVFALLLLQFSKGVTLFRNTYSITLKSSNVGGLRPRAQVLMSGVQVGTVSRTELAPSGTNVSIYLRIYGQYIIRNDATFKIEQSGFLGDQYVAIYPGTNADSQVLTNNSVSFAMEPFNLQEVARSASGFIQRLDVTARKLDGAIDDVRRLVLNDHTLTDLSQTISDLRHASEDALVTVDNVNALIKSNGAPASEAISNLMTFSTRLELVADHVDGILATNAPPLSVAISNVQASTIMITNLLGGLESGKGLAGSVLKNEDLSGNISTVASNLAITTGNLNRLGFWHWIWYKPSTNNASKQGVVYPSEKP